MRLVFVAIFFHMALLVWSSNFEPRHATHWGPNTNGLPATPKEIGKGGAPAAGGHHHRRLGSGKVTRPPTSSPSPQKSTTFNVLDFGAKGDGNADDTKAFGAAWASACGVASSTVLVPSGSVFLVGPISFTGPDCKPGIVFQLDGKIVGPTSSGAWKSGGLQWIEFEKLNSFTISGKGAIDGRGSLWWNNLVGYDPEDSDADATAGKMPGGTKPTAVRFYGSNDVKVRGITIQNSPQTHLKFDSCTGVQVFDFTTSSPGDSPNTDGIHLQNSQNVLVYRSTLACGDDCVSIQSGCSQVYIHDVSCGPGHGISIGGLGKDDTKACVSNVTVRDVTMTATLTAVRIKTWQGGSGSVNQVMFSNIQVSEVETPIMIDQYYCNGGSKCKNQTSAVAVSGINYMNIKGTYTMKPVHIACSDSVPCSGVSFSTIQLEAVEQGQHVYQPYCWEAYGKLKTDTQPPIDCLQPGDPPSSGSSDTDHCSPN